MNIGDAAKEQGGKVSVLSEEVLEIHLRGMSGECLGELALLAETPAEEFKCLLAEVTATEAEVQAVVIVAGEKIRGVMPVSLSAWLQTGDMPVTPSRG